MKRPDCVTQEHLEYLDNLRESGITNMFGAGQYIERAFSVDRQTAGEILQYWMKSFGDPER